MRLRSLGLRVAVRPRGSNRRWLRRWHRLLGVLSTTARIALLPLWLRWILRWRILVSHARAGHILLGEGVAP